MIRAPWIEQDQRTAPEHRHHGVNISVIVQISKSGAASGYCGPTWNVQLLELAGRIPEQDGWLEVAQPGMNLLQVIQHVALRYKQILPSVIIEIE
jgi:hypothetical protein